MSRLMLSFGAFALAASFLGMPVAQAAVPAPAASASPAAVPSPTPTPDPAILKRAESLFAQLQKGTLDKSQLTAQMAAAMSDSVLAAAKAQVGPLGTPVTFEQQQLLTRGGMTVYVYLLAFGNAQTWNFVMALDASGKVAGLRAAPAK